MVALLAQIPPPHEESRDVEAASSLQPGRHCRGRRPCRKHHDGWRRRHSHNASGRLHLLIERKADTNGGDSPLGNLIADAQKADPSVVTSGGVRPVIALMNPGGIRGDLVENANGDVTYEAAFTVQPFNNFVVSMDLTGAQIRAILNEQWNGPNEPTTSRKILQVSGISYTWDVSDAEAPWANAIVGDVLVDADGNPGTAMVPMQNGTTYRVVANNFLADGGDNFGAFRQGTNRLVGGLDIDSLRRYLQANDPVSPTPTDRISQQP